MPLTGQRKNQRVTHKEIKNFVRNLEIKDVLVASNLYLCNNFMKIYYSIPSIYDKSWPTNEEKNKDG